ncbi:sigma-54 interaction domain-containing protein [Pseudomonas typographi]|uniref:sigma-54 interaction domain-containing protein n=1 Tax=Pseudomonas typographi TaxID=2715964 RepID=UPI00168A2DCF|nr:sigma 54-interacting transcriptional regulator [Pseudomonas typographi]MBD1587054.1 sigma 54-interacting transcriptional regulator [Pseudomonas typographi]
MSDDLTRAFINIESAFNFLIDGQCTKESLLASSRTLSLPHLDDTIALLRAGARRFCVLWPHAQVDAIDCEAGLLGSIHLIGAATLTPLAGLSEPFGPAVIQVLDSISDGIVVCDSSGVVLFQNREDRVLVGSDCTGKSMQTCVTEGLVSNSATLQVLSQRRPVNLLQDYANGRKILVSAVPIFDEQGNVRFVTSSSRDLTHLKNLESEISRLEKNNRAMIEVMGNFRSGGVPAKKIVLNDAAMKSVMERATRIAGVDATVLVLGESGVGKEMWVKYMHETSPRSAKNLVCINCGAIPENLLESELFGYEGGAFTGAKAKGKIGLFELAQGGTLFLDEVGELPLQLQTKLLRALQELEITRVGGLTPIKVDVRIIAATNRDLEQRVRCGAFREDLFYRLNILPLHIPPLRHRRLDIPSLIEMFLNELTQKYQMQRYFSEDALAILVQHDWPGNIRQLRNIVERLCITSLDNAISAVQVRKELGPGAAPGITQDIDGAHLANQPAAVDSSGDLTMQVKRYEKQIIVAALARHPSIRQAAKALGLDQSTLVRKIQRHGIKKHVSYEQ